VNDTVKSLDGQDVPVQDHAHDSSEVMQRR
jgi:hypothetical protein